MKEIRYYQQEAIDAVDAALQDGIKENMLVMATGTGKTFTACQVVNKFNHCLWITHTEELIDQSAKALLQSEFKGSQDRLTAFMKKYVGVVEFLDGVDNIIASGPLFGHEYYEEAKEVKSLIGVIKRERMDTAPKIIVASIQTIWRRLDKINADIFDIIVIDECHMAMAKTWAMVIEHFKYKLLLGLTATPYRSDGMSLGNIFTKIVYDYDILTAINDGFLCELDAIRCKTAINLDSVRTTAGELNQADLRIVDCEPRNKFIVEQYLKYAKGRQAIVFCVDVQHSIHVAEAFALQGISVSFVVGDVKLCPDRKARISLFKSGDIDVLSNCMVLTAGFDHPEVACIIMACPTKSLTKFVQCIGRGTRLKRELKDCKIIDIVDATTRHRLVNTHSLDEGKRIEDRIFMTKERKKSLIEDREERKRKIDSEKLSNKDKKINLFDIPKVKVISSAKMKEPATDKQLAWIARLGYDILDTVYTKQMCSDIIGNQPASSAQIGKLKSEGYIIPIGVTFAEAQAAFAEIDERNGVEPTWKAKLKGSPIQDVQ